MNGCHFQVIKVDGWENDHDNRLRMCWCELQQGNYRKSGKHEGQIDLIGWEIDLEEPECSYLGNGIGQIDLQWGQIDLLSILWWKDRSSSTQIDLFSSLFGSRSISCFDRSISCLKFHENGRFKGTRSISSWTRSISSSYFYIRRAENQKILGKTQIFYF